MYFEDCGTVLYYSTCEQLKTVFPYFMILHKFICVEQSNATVCRGLDTPVKNIDFDDFGGENKH